MRVSSHNWQDLQAKVDSIGPAADQETAPEIGERTERINYFAESIYDKAMIGIGNRFVDFAKSSPCSKVTFTH